MFGVLEGMATSIVMSGAIIGAGIAAAVATAAGLLAFCWFAPPDWGWREPTKHPVVQRLGLGVAGFVGFTVSGTVYLAIV